MTVAQNGAPRHRRWPRPLRIVRARPRLFLCLAIGIVVFVALTATGWRLASRLLVSWDVLVGLYLALALQMMSSADVHRMRRRARLQDEGQIAILVLTATAALASLAAIVALLSTAGGNARTAGDLILATLTIVLSWGFTHTMFAQHYAHEFYAENAVHGGGMGFQ